MLGGLPSAATGAQALQQITNTLGAMRMMLADTHEVVGGIALIEDGVRMVIQTRISALAHTEDSCAMPASLGREKEQGALANVLAGVEKICRAEGRIHARRAQDLSIQIGNMEQVLRTLESGILLASPGMPGGMGGFS
jgi:hypothetical protein